MIMMCTIHVKGDSDGWIEGYDFVPLLLDDKVSQWVLANGSYDSKNLTWSFEGEDRIRLDDYMQRFYQKNFLPELENLPDWVRDIRLEVCHIPTSAGVTEIL